eukprot:m.391280 g.391280  ORF g.391280 m.391280 type:complete len:301 (-) comp20080_c0_seq16:2572-3474(-)
MHACTHSVLADQAPDQQVPPFLTGPGSAMAVIVWFVVSASGSVILHGEQRQGQARRLCVVACKSRFVFRACRILFQLLDRCFPDHMDAKLAVLRELALVDPVAEELVQIPKLLLEEPADIVGLASPELVVERVTKAGSRALRKKFKDEPMSDSATSGSEVPEEVRRKAFLGTTKHSATTAWLLVVSPRTEVFATVNGDARTVASAWQRSMAPFTNTKLFACLRRPCPSRSFAVEWSARRGLNQWHCGSSLPRCCQPFPKAFCLLAAWRHRTFSVGKTVFVGGDRFLLAQTAHQHHYGQQR